MRTRARPSKPFSRAKPSARSAAMTSRNADSVSARSWVTRKQAVHTRSARARVSVAAAPAPPRRAAVRSSRSGSACAVTVSPPRPALPMTGKRGNISSPTLRFGGTRQKTFPVRLTLQRPDNGSPDPATMERPMPGKWKILATLLSLCLPQCGGVHAETDNPEGYRLSDPVVHGNLAIYFVFGKSRSGPVPLTLQEALARKVITVRETGQVNELQVENIGADEVFIQSGDIVKGGQQDRVLSVSMLLPPPSGAISIDSFCVESGRWSARGVEDARTFSSATAALPSRSAKLAIASG